ncbi:restriction endonuclease subunit S [Arthrobacter sp. E44]|uniref:restriction endonuclease subunit S n=1 Tax=Arthrobacter sp. E44 TaxID=3341794 RepID=UPI0035A5DA82
MREGWREAALADVAVEVKARLQPGTVADLPYVALEHVSSGVPKIVRSGLSQDTVSPTTLFQPGDVLFSKLRPYLNKVAVAEEEGCCTKEILVWRTADESAVSPSYLALLLRSGQAIQYATDMSAGSRMPRVSSGQMEAFRVWLPPLDEQRRIADLITAMDESIAASAEVAVTAEELVDELREQLFMPKSNWDETELGDHLTRISEPVRVLTDETYTEIGVRSHGRGAFLKAPITGAALGNKRVFFVRPGQLVFNIVFAWEGAVAVLGPETEGMIASHRFPTFASPVDDGVDLLAHFFQTAQGKGLLDLCSPGGAGRNRTLNQKALMSSVVKIPPVEEWSSVVRLLISAINHAVACRESEHELRTLRSELLTVLLSGEHEIPSTYDEVMSAAF